MDAKKETRDLDKQQLLLRLAELMVDEQREEGVFDAVPHFSTLEQAARDLGQELSRAAQQRASAEVAAIADATVACPGCQRRLGVTFGRRTVTGPDGPVELVEPVAHCPACRRDFFPSTRSDGAR